MTNVEPVTPKKRGCFFYGCITCLIVLLVGGLTCFFAVRYAFHYAERMIAQYTDTSPIAIEQVTMPEAELTNLEARVNAFSAMMNAHSNTPPLVLTGPEINALLARNPQMRQFKNTFYVALDGDEIKAQLSLPLDLLTNIQMVNALDIKGRYFNGSGSFKASITNGRLSVFPQSLTVKGQPLPEKVMASFRQQNLADGFNNNPANTSPFEGYESIQVKDGTLIVKPKAN